MSHPNATIHEADTESRIHSLGNRLWDRIRDKTPGAFNREFWVGKVLEWAMDDRSFKVDLFRLVDVLPVLEKSEQVREHIQDYLLKPGRTLPHGVETALRLGTKAWTGGLASMAVHKGVEEMGQRFIIAETPQKAIHELRKLHEAGFAFTVDLLGEATHSHSEADAYAQRYHDLIETLSAKVGEWPRHDLIDRGDNRRANLSVKVSALEPHLDAADPVGSVRRVMERLLPLVIQAKQAGVFVNLDMEQWDYHGIILDVFETLCRHAELRDYPHLGLAIQAYSPHAEADLDRLLAVAKDRGTPLTVRLIKGAYWDYEMVRTALHGYPLPVFEHKWETDANFERLTLFLLAHHDHLFPAIGSHNLRSIVHALVRAEELGIAPEAMELQMLYGMAEPMREAFHDEGHRVRVYSPIGALIPGMAYLVRRLLENTSNEGFLTKAYHHGEDVSDLLQPPRQFAAVSTKSVPEPFTFTNCPHGDFTDPRFRESFAKHVATVRNELPLNVPIVVNGETITDRETMERPNPSDTAHNVANVRLATIDDAERAVAAAANAYPAWRDTSVEARVDLLDALATALETDRQRLAAIQVHEVAKPWREADADVTEAIDFCRYYARQAREELSPRPMRDVSGEANMLLHEGRGPTVIIAPWNFPLAIFTGMTAAALVTGNPVLLKPAEQSSATAYALFEHLQALDLPSGVAQFLPGVGETIGAHLVNHRDVANIAFTGSKAVGLKILEAAGKTHPDQPQIKRAVCEMGGKNAIIVDSDADFDEAVAGVIRSAFGYAGQKCSACSRLFVIGTAYDPIIKRLIEATKSLNVAPADDPSCQIPPVVDDEAFNRLMKEIASLRDDSDVLFQGDAPTGGYYIAPHIVRVDNLGHHLMQDELFGPILAVKPVDTFDDALDAANSTRFALTGSVYSRNPSHLDEARRRFRVGNLYLNRGCTGSMVGRQPFGGFAMSGTDAKAGGPNYLLHFVDPRVVTENTLRRGFSPDIME